LDEARLREIASNYGLPIKNWRRSDEVALVEDPVRLIAQRRYPAGAAGGPLPLLLRFVERLVEEERGHGVRSGLRSARPTQYVTL
jgi:hypothetical protein